jgi:hypothetical protein
VAEDEKTDDEKSGDAKPARGRRKAEGEICGLCWPDGWQGEDAAATCEHGSYKR